MNTRSILNFYKSVETVANGFARMVTNIFTFSITELAPLLAPLPPAFAIFTAMSERLHVPFYVAVIAAIAIEVIGLFSSKVSIRCYQWNSSKAKSDPSVPQGFSILMTSIFFVVVLLLALTVELFPSLTSLVIPGFIFISVSTYFNLAIHTNLEKLETARTNDTDLRKEKNGLAADIRKAKSDLEKLTTERLKLASDISNQKEMTSLEGKDLDGQSNVFGPQNLEMAQLAAKGNSGVRISERRTSVFTLKSQKLTNKAIAERLGVSLSTVKSDLKSLNGSLK